MGKDYTEYTTDYMDGAMAALFPVWFEKNISPNYTQHVEGVDKYYFVYEVETVGIEKEAVRLWFERNIDVVVQEENGASENKTLLQLSTREQTGEKGPMVHINPTHIVSVWVQEITARFGDDPHPCAVLTFSMSDGQIFLAVEVAKLPSETIDQWRETYSSVYESYLLNLAI